MLSHEIYVDGNAKKKYINFLDQFAKWVNKRNESEYLKLLCLKHCLYDSLYNSFIYCIACNLDYELLNIEFKIDKDFISNEDDYWKSYSLRSIQEMTTKKPLPMLVDWPRNHPIREKYIIQEKGFDLKFFFDRNLKFEDSKKHFEIRIADIGAIILNRNLNGKGLKAHYSKIRNKKAANNAFRNLEFKDFDLDVELRKIKSGTH